MLKAVIFDMDGVLIDSEPLHYEANRLLLERRFNINLDYEYYKQFIGSTVTYLWEKMRSDFMTAGDCEDADACENIGKYEALELRNMADEIKEELISTDGYMKIEGANVFVKSLRGHYKLAVASSSYLKNIERNVNNLDIADCFDELVSGTEVKCPKSSPDIFLLAAERLGIKPNECIVIEDSENGVNAAKAAGMACVGFINENSGNQNLSKADFLFESFDSIDGDFLNMVHAHCFDERLVVAENERLLLREMLVKDVEDENTRKLIVEALSMNEDMNQHSETGEVCLREKTNEELKKYVAEYRKNSYKFLGFGLWLVELKNADHENMVIGMAGIDRKEDGEFELGYYILEEYRGQGYAYEACSKILSMTQEWGIDEVSVRIAKENVPSLRLAERLGFREIGNDNAYKLLRKEVD